MEDSTSSNSAVADSLVVEKGEDYFSPTYQLTFTNYKCIVKPEIFNTPYEKCVGVIEKIFEELLERVLTDKIMPTDKVRIRLYSDHLLHKGPIWTVPCLKSELTVERVMASIERVIQSSTSFRLDDTFEIQVQYVRVPAGTGPPPNISDNVRRLLKNKKAVVRIKNDDELCLPRAIVTGKALADNDPAYNSLRDTHASKLSPGRQRSLQTARALSLVRDTGLEERRYSLDDLSKFQEILCDYQIIVVGLEQLNSIVFAGEFKTKRIMLLHHQSHFDTLTSLQAWYEKSRWCFHCNLGYDLEGTHRCKDTCKTCLREKCEKIPGYAKHCGDCNRSGFHSDDCFNHHAATDILGKKGKVIKHSICQKFKVCGDCGSFVKCKKKRESLLGHICGEVFCSVCHTYVMPDSHTCYMMPERIDDQVMDKHKKSDFMYLDFETFPGPNGVFVPNFAVIQVQTDDGPVEIHQFPADLSGIGRDISDEVCSFIFQKKHAKYYCLAHNFRGFDGYFILKWLLKNGQAPSVIMKGSQITHLEDKEFNICFRDTLNYVPMSLDNWAKSFGVEQTKGKFPHPLNRPDYWNKIVEYPDPDLFGIKFMGEKDKAEFLRFHKADREQKKGLYNVNAELADYCHQDVTTLRCCAVQLRNLFRQITGGFCIFQSGLTLPSVCHYFWRARLLKENEVEIVHPPSNRTSSQKADKWLRYISESQSIELLKEFRIGAFSVDGYHANSHTAYEFYGCLHHGHPACTNPTTRHPHLDSTMSELFDKTMKREAVLKVFGITPVRQWECEYDKMLKVDKAFSDRIKTIQVTDRLSPRKALYGGRVNAVVLNYRVKPGEKIMYLDVVSEYPFVNKNKRYPVGKHVCITQNFDSLEKYFGLAYCKVLPPRSLFLPVLPAHFDKLIFTLCRLCAETKNQDCCEHGDEERALTGTWCTIELAEAVKVGYVVMELYEVWHFEDSRERFFASYIDLFLALKVEASGWPSEVKSDADKEEFLQTFYQTEGIQLDPTKISLNPGMRQLAKLCLNSFWGRLGMRDNQLATVFINSAKEFYHYLTSSEYEVHGWDMFSEEVLQLTYKRQGSMVPTNPKTNVVLAAFTTAHARLHLLQFMQQAGKRLLYFDTDSIIFVQKDSDVPFHTGSTLGMLSNELDEDDYITEFCSTGPKSYGYRTAAGKSVVKVKGITINNDVKSILNFQSMQVIATSSNGDVEPLAITYDCTIRREKRAYDIKEVPITKHFRKTYDKRRILPDDTTVPYGYNVSP